MRLTGGEIVAEYLIKEGIPYLVGVPGHGCLGLVDAFIGREDRIKILQVRHEQSAAHLADGYYRVSGQPLAVFTSIGPGAINTAIGVATAYVDSMPILVLSGDTHTHMFGRGVLQEIERQHSSDFPQIMKPIVKRYWQVMRVDQLPHVMQRAFNQMLTGRRGPVLISLPMDVQCEAADVVIPEPAQHEPQGRLNGDPKLVVQAAQLLNESHRPVILVGGGVHAAEAYEELRQVAEFLGAAVITTMMGKSAFPENHPLYAWHAGSKGTSCGRALSSTADVVLAIGCRFADETTSSYRQGVSYSIPPTKLIHIDLDPTEIGKNYPVEVGIVGDAKAVLAELLVALQELGPRDEALKAGYREEIQRHKAAWWEEIKEFRESDLVPVTISRFLKELRAVLPEEAIVVTSSGNAQAQILQEFPFTQPRTLVTTGGFSTMGFTLPAVLGAKLAAPNRPVVGVLGDGDFLMTVQELATAVQYNFQVVICVLNNIGWISIKDLQMAVYGEKRAMATDFLTDDGRLYSPDFAALAHAFGAYGERIERAEEVAPAMKRALEIGRPAVVEVMVNRQYPYTGGKVAGWWDVPVPAYLTERYQAYKREAQEEALR